MAFLTDEQALQRVSDILKATGPSNLPAHWANTIVPDANTWAYQEIVDALASRGFSAAQIAAWDRGAEFQIDLAVYRALSKGGSLLNVDDRLLKSYDRREELHGNERNGIRAVSVLNSGVWQAPASTTGQISTGRQTTNTDIFVLDPDDPNLGEVFRS